MSSSSSEFARQRANMVAQIRTNDVTDIGLQAAMLEIPRELFVPIAHQPMAYSDRSIEVARGRFLLDPRAFAKLVQLADIQPTDKVLDVGCATGYSTAVLASLAAQVTGLEQDADLVQTAGKALGALGIANAAVTEGRLAGGLSGEAPFNVIFVNGAVTDRPDTLLSQLADGGRLVCLYVKGNAGGLKLTEARLYVRTGDATGFRSAFDADAPVLPGFEKTAGFVF